MQQMILHAFQQAHDNFTRMLAEFLPRFLLMVVVILIGWLVAYLLKVLLRGILRVARVEKMSEEAGTSRLLRRADLPSMTELLSRAVFWVVWLGFIIVGISFLDIGSLQQQIANLIAVLPQIFVALLILFVGLLAANFFSRAALLAGVNAGLSSPKVLSGIVRTVIIFLALSMALEQIGLGKQTMEIAFSIVFGALMLGLAIAFGLGGRHLAKRLLEKHFFREREQVEHDDELSPL
ncbi:MAG: mechanosensitive ion channel family protein [Candidatus Acidiferrales bacterium]